MKETGTIRRIRDLIDGRHRVYLFFAGQDAKEDFRRRARNEWIRFCDGREVSDRETAQIMRLLDDGTVCYVGLAGFRAFYVGEDRDILRVDYEKYAAGCADPVIPFPVRRREGNFGASGEAD